MDEVLEGALSADNAVRRQAEERLSHAASQRGFAVALATKFATNNNDRTMASNGSMADAHRLMAGAVLLRFVRRRWEQASYCSAEDKAQVWWCYWRRISRPFVYYVVCLGVPRFWGAL